MRMLMVVFTLAVLADLLLAAQDEYSAKVPGGLSLSAFRGYES